MKYMLKRNILHRLLLIVAIVSFISVNLSFAQNWQALPPYNTLWPLWSSVLSPLDPATGLPTPLVSTLSSDTILPMMPGLTWDPAIAYPWLLYNSPAGMLYFDPLLGIDSWPPKGFIHGNTPVPIALPLGYSALAPTTFSTLKNIVPLGNLAYITALPTFAPAGGFAGTTIVPPTLTSLLSAATIAGIGVPGAPMVIAPPVPLTPIVPPVPPIPVVPPVPLAPALPTPVIPPIAPTPLAIAPTPIAPVPTAVISALTFSLPSFLSGVPSSSSTAVAPVITNWSGYWISLLSTSQLGPMSLSLSQNTATGVVTGTASLLLNKLIPLPVTVSGTFLGGTVFTLTGVFTDYQLALSGLFIIPIDYTLTLNCTLTSATTMSGNYSILSVKENDIGSFNLNLI